MNAWQVIRELKKRISEQRWEGTGELVFANTVISMSPTEELLMQSAYPLAVIRLGGGNSDPSFNEEPDLILRDFIVTTYVLNTADGYGEGMVIGSHRLGTDRSEGRGVLEIEEEVVNSIGAINREEAVAIYNTLTGEVAVSFFDNLGFVAEMEYTYSALVTAERSYFPVCDLVASSPGAGMVQLDWENPPDRFDRFELILRVAAGPTPPASPVDGSGIPIVGFPTTVMDTPGSGEFSYSLFVGYDEYETGVSNRFSEAETVTITV